MTTCTCRLTVLVEDTSDREDIVPEHGWSVFVECGGTRGLFDTGQTENVLGNARALGVDLSSLSWIVLSHGHYDHTGGLKSILEIAKRPVLHAHPLLFLPKYVREGNGTWREAGISMSRGDIERTGCTIRLDGKPASIQAHVGTTGEVPRKTAFESVPAHFFVEKNGRKVRDHFPDDQSLVLQTRKGIVVLLGCCHAGVVNTLRHVGKIAGVDRLHAVIGGMHLGAASPERIGLTTQAFLEYDVEKIGPAHCTGAKAAREFRSVLGERAFPCPAGTVLEF